jgi:hypothetical protein
MGTLKTSLGQALSERKVPCRVSGCEGHWVWSPRDQLETFSKGTLDPPERMCPECYKKYKEMGDKQVECSRPECTNTWTWSRGAQVRHAKHEGRDGPPARLCEACQAEAVNLKDRQVRCRVSGCSNTWTWTAAHQVRAGLPEKKVKTPQRMCKECHQEYQRLEPRVVPCRMDGCENHWHYGKDQQLRDMVKGRSMPERMCDSCYERFKGLEDREIECRIPGCKKTWRWPRGAQLQTWIESGRDEPRRPPQRMCPECSEQYSKLEDVKVRCKIAGCSGTWTDKRGAQLARMRQGKSTDRPERLCDECQKKLSELEVVQVPCRNEGCDRTWGWKRGAQLRAIKGRRNDSAPPDRMCDTCNGFVNSHPRMSIVCRKCSAEIPWSTDNQLKVFLGLWREPELCGTCRALPTAETARDRSESTPEETGPQPAP